MNRFPVAGMAALVLLLAACGKPAPGHHEAAGAEADAHEAAALSTVIAPGVARAAGIRVAPAAPGIIADEHVVQGLLTPVEGRMVEVVARFPGPVRSMRAGVGETVRAGQTVATVDSNLSLSTYAVRAPMTGTVTARHASVGTMASEGTVLLEIADLSTLWVDLHLFGSDAGHIEPGSVVNVTRLTDGGTVTTRIERVLPGMATASQSTIARARIANPDGLWRPGAAVRARITVARKEVDLAVPLSALQAIEGRPVVFVRTEKNVYEARHVETGARDGIRTEITAGLLPGEDVVVRESYLVKADMLKEGAGHEH